MTARPGRPEQTNAYLRPIHWHREVLATAIRERSVTNRCTTVVIRGLRRWWIAAVVVVGVACGGGKRADTYARASDVQGECCEHLAGGQRDKCLADIVRIEDRDVAKTEVNQATYACVVDHFECNPTTGHPTQPSAQAQLECIQDLP